MDLLPLFRGLSDPVRLRIVHLLCQKQELCGCHLTDALSLPQSTVSRHLNTLRINGLVEAQRKGKWVYYRMIDTENVAIIANLIRASCTGDEQLQKDLSNLKDTSC